MLPLFIHVARLHKQQQLSLSLSSSLSRCANLPLLCVYFCTFFIVCRGRRVAARQHAARETDCDLATPVTTATTTLLPTSAVSLPLSLSLSLSLTPNFWLALPLLAVKRDFFQINFSYIYVCLNFSTIFFQSAPATHHTRAIHVSCLHVCVCACVYVYQIRNCTLHAPHSICGI